ncbi:MAG: YbhB/YbcL family Raf kinase inhibitor-like protein [Patescibacteria group bacterium]|nr:YbhB/YbcL family Raf kinase inhibitor-like protein [Patescibacteria group bacterium]
MKKIIIVIIILAAAVMGFVWWRKPSGKTVFESPSNQTANPASKEGNNMKIESQAFKDGENIPAKYTCDGEGVNPPLEFGNVPAEAKSLALIMDDPDAPGKTWTHWLVWNIDPAVSRIAENSVPEGAMQGQASSGQNNYGGPCPPSGTHRYYFKVYALDAKLDIPSYSDQAALEQAMDGHIIGQAELVGLYSRQ